MAKRKSQKEVGTTILYANRFNVYEIATIVRDSFIDNITNPDAIGGPIADDDIDLEMLAKFLSEGFLPEALEEFSHTAFGKGVLLGAYLEHTMSKNKADEIAALEEMENEREEI